MKIRGSGGFRNDVGNTFFKMSHSRTCEKKIFTPKIKIYGVYLSYIINNIDNNNEKTINM